MTRARARYPNLAALAQGLVSGDVGEWPMLKLEAADLLDETDRWHALVDEAVEARRPDYVERAAVAVLLVLLIGVVLTFLRLGGGVH